MSAPRICDGRAPRHRQAVPRQRRSVRFELHPGVYDKLLALGLTDKLGRPEPAVSIVERLITSAHAELSQPTH